MKEFSYRPYYVEWRGELQFDSPFHIGTGERWRIDSDMPVAREGGERSNPPYIPASSLRGVLREHLERECELLGFKPETVESLFGRFGKRGQDDAENELSRLRLFDACVGEDQWIQAEVRDHVRIDPAHGAAAYRAKFDMETAQPSEETVLNFRMVYEGESANDGEFRLAEEALRALSAGELRIGGHSGWGYGRMRLKKDSIQRAVFVRSNVEDLARFLEFRGCPKKFLDECAVNENGTGPVAVARRAVSTLEYRIELRFEGPMLVKGALPRMPAKEEDPLQWLDQPGEYAKKGEYMADHAALQSGGQIFLPGASLRGVLRAQAARICASQNAPSILKLCFGSEKDEAAGMKGLFEFGGGRIPDSGAVREVFIDHVAIDRITQTAAAKKKFATLALDSPRFEVHIRARLPKERLYAGALLALLLWDLKNGRIWAGSGVTRGYGKIGGMRILSFRASLVESAAAWGAPNHAVRKRGRLEVTHQNPEWNDLAWLWKTLDGHWQQVRNRDAS